jgi:hypothetical protein
VNISDQMMTPVSPSSATEAVKVASPPQSPGATASAIQLKTASIQQLQTQDIELSKWETLKHDFDHNFVSTRLRKYFKSRLYFGLGITLTLLALIFSAVAKMCNERKLNTAANVMVLLFSVIIVYEDLEATTRIIVMRSYGAVFDGLILYIDLAVNLYVLITYINSGFSLLSKVNFK